MIIFILFLLTATCDATSGHYECGEHGRFEYCIDDNPGCVIGCHCFPGYYFDTDSKICEPNAKLTLDYRRHLTPTGYHPLGVSSALVPPVVPAPPPAPEPPLLPGPSEPSQDSNDGDLSEWLYKQFFKTIESQVVNKTDDEPLKVKTRRSGASIEPLITRRRSDRRRKSRNRKKKDDEESESSSSSESDSGDSSRGLGSWERFEIGPRPGSENGPSEPKKDGSHREIVMYSKKPKPPLPSFIFLPNMGTMFYPPIGVPVPPMPMYPMVPIPPIQPGQMDNCTNNETTVATTTSEATTPTSAASKTVPTTPSSEMPTSQAASQPTKEPDVKPNAATKQPSLRNMNFHNRVHPKLRSKPQARQVFKPSLLPPPFDYPAQPYHAEADYDGMFMGDNPLHEGSPDFKYISDLIHKNISESANRSSTLNNPQRDPFSGMKPPMPYVNRRRDPIAPGRLDSTRRRFDPRKNGEDEAYYSSLGKEIAKLIRGLDSTNVVGADVNIGPPKPSHPYFNENSHAARNYWERFVRSPLSLRMKNFTKYEDIIASNEDLFQLENQVEEATYTPVLGWLELENVINTMGFVRNEVQDRAIKNTNMLANASLNVSLLPRFAARTSIVSHKPETINSENTFFATFQDVVRKATKSNLKQKITKKEFDNKTEERNELSKNAINNNFVYNIPNPIYLKPRRLFATLKPILRTSHMKNNKLDIEQAKPKLKFDHSNGKINNLNQIGNKPHIISIGEKMTFVKSRKYFFDHGISNQYENWIIN